MKPKTKQRRSLPRRVMPLFLQQTDTGEPCPRDIEELKQAVRSKPLNVGGRVEVWQWTLAKVLDYVTVLEHRLKNIEGTVSEPTRNIRLRLRYNTKLTDGAGRTIKNI